MQRDAAADRTADHDRPVEFERGRDLQDHGRVLRRGELILLLMPARRRRRLAVPGHVEGNDAMFCGDARVVHQAAILPPVAARGVQAQQRRALARLLDIDAVRPAEQIEMHVAAGDRLEPRAHAAAPVRAQLGERFLEVAQMRHEDLQIAFGLQHAPLDQRQQIVGARRRPHAPELLPFLLGRPQRKGRGRHHERALASPTRCGPRRSGSARRSARPPAGNVVVRYRPRRTSPASSLTRCCSVSIISALPVFDGRSRCAIRYRP